ncbi:MAG: hypothetical protein ACR2MO_13635 [Acidimicrobiales bacterium]
MAQDVGHGNAALEGRVPFGRLGSFEITHIDKVDNGLLFYEQTGNLFDDAGFAYLPAGPTPDLESGGFESPQFRSLGGGWYAWTASW